VLIVQLASRGASLTLSTHLVATSSETTLLSTRDDVDLPREHPLADSFAPAARRVATACAMHLPAARPARARGTRP
jgi:hypothetical protein